MAGVKQFDQNEVLDRAMMLFWSQGYEATSIDQLVEATGINRGSLYGTFNDKNGIFLAVIDRYLETVAKSLMVPLSDPNPRQAIERMFDSIVGRLSDPKFPRGCLIVNTSLRVSGQRRRNCPQNCASNRPTRIRNLSRSASGPS